MGCSHGLPYPLVPLLFCQWRRDGEATAADQRQVGLGPLHPVPRLRLWQADSGTRAFVASGICGLQGTAGQLYTFPWLSSEHITSTHGCTALKRAVPACWPESPRAVLAQVTDCSSPCEVTLNSAGRQFREYNQ